MILSKAVAVSPWWAQVSLGTQSGEPLVHLMKSTYFVGETPNQDHLTSCGKEAQQTEAADVHAATVCPQCNLAAQRQWNRRSS